MTQILVDAVTPESLKHLTEPVEIINEQGRRIGTFCPCLEPPYDPSLIPELSAEEQARIYAAPGIYTTQEVLRHLESL